MRYHVYSALEDIRPTEGLHDLSHSCLGPGGCSLPWRGGLAGAAQGFSDSGFAVEKSLSSESWSLRKKGSPLQSSYLLFPFPTVLAPRTRVSLMERQHVDAASFPVLIRPGWMEARAWPSLGTLELAPYDISPWERRWGGWLCLDIWPPLSAALWGGNHLSFKVH